MSQPDYIYYYDWGLGLGVRIGDWDFGLGIRIGDLDLGFGIGDWD